MNDDLIPCGQCITLAACKSRVEEIHDNLFFIENDIISKRRQWISSITYMLVYNECQIARKYLHKTRANDSSYNFELLVPYLTNIKDESNE